MYVYIYLCVWRGVFVCVFKCVLRMCFAYVCACMCVTERERERGERERVCERESVCVRVCVCDSQSVAFIINFENTCRKAILYTWKYLAYECV